MSRSNIRYSTSFKQMVVHQVELGQESVLSARRKYKINGSMTIYRWIAQNRDGILGSDAEVVDPMPYTKMPIIDVPKEELAQKDARIYWLELQVKALEHTIAIAEKELGISLKKKFVSGLSNPSDQTTNT